MTSFLVGEVILIFVDKTKIATIV